MPDVTHLNTDDIKYWTN